jgi:hypothetical protein
MRANATRRADKFHRDPCRALAHRQLRDELRDLIAVDFIPAALALRLVAPGASSMESQTWSCGLDFLCLLPLPAMLDPEPLNTDQRHTSSAPAPLRQKVAGTDSRLTLSKY